MDARQFHEKLVQIGYPHADKLSLNTFSYLLEDEELAAFFEVFQQIDENNILTPEEVKRYEALEASGAKILELDELEAAKIGSKEAEVPIKDLRKEVFLLSEELLALEQEKVMQEDLNETLSKNIMTMNTRFEDARLESKETEKAYQRAVIECQVANKELNKVFEEAKVPLSIIEVVAKMANTATPESLYLTFIPLIDFQKAYKEYNVLLKEYICKQFHAEIMNIAELGLEMNYELIDLKVHPVEKLTAEQLKMYKLLKMHHGSFCKVENQLVMASVIENGIKKQIKAGEDLLASIVKGVFPDMAILSHKLMENKADEARYKADVDNVKENIIPKLVSSLADANASSIITGNYALKWKRQQYVTTKMDQLIFWLAEHQSQAEFYSLCLTSEYGIFKQTHQFLQFVQATSEVRFEGYKNRMAAMEQLRLAVHKYEAKERENVALLETIERMLQSYNGSRGEKRVQNRVQRLVDKVECMKNSMVAGRMQVTGNFLKETEQLEQINFNLMSLRDVVWADCPTKTGPPHLGPKEIDLSMEKCKAKLKKLEYEFLAARLTLQEKEKMLNCNDELKKLRTGYLDFYSKLLCK